MHETGAVVLLSNVTLKGTTPRFGTTQVEPPPPCMIPFLSASRLAPPVLFLYCCMPAQMAQGVHATRLVPPRRISAVQGHL